MDTKNKKTKVIVAMSGGVDSSVAAALLKKQGCELIGVFMKFWQPPLCGGARIHADGSADLRGYENRCCSSDAENRARQVAKILNIPFYVLNFEKEFKKRVVDYFLKELKTGRTPNPCVVCNREIKFGLLLEKALKLGADYVATGHYARLKREIPNSKLQITNKAQILKFQKIKLFMAKDKNKDQSYFLWQLNQKQLSRILFPIGDYTRKEVEKMARKFKLPFSGVKKSFEVCFIPKTLKDFLVKYIKNKPGDIIDKSGKKLGRHQGLWFYTIGQRRGIEINGGQTSVRLQGSDPCKTAKILSGKPFYVLDKDAKNNLLIVTQNEKKLYRKELIAKNVNWISGEEPKLPLKVKVKIRYRGKSASAFIVRQKGTKEYKLIFGAPQRAITPGQSVVFYKREELIGGGAIDINN